MWLMFAVACLLCVAVLYVPGYLMGRSFGLSASAALAVAPAFAVVILVCLGVLLEALSISCPAWALFAVSFVLSCGAFLVRKLALNNLEEPQSINVKLLMLYIGVSLAVSLVVFVHAMADPNGFCRLDDSVAHYSLVRSFLDTGYYSTLRASSYAALGDVGGFYPAAWHVVVAVVASLVGNSVALASNAASLIVCAVVLPVGLAYFMSQLFPGKEEASLVAVGAFVAVAFCGFPWGFLVWGQLLPNLLSFSLAPAAMGLLVSLSCSKVNKLPYIISFAFCLIAIAVAQPNGAFTLGIWTVAFGVSWVLSCFGSSSRAKGILLASLILVGACVLWVLMFLAPPLQMVTSYSWPAFLSPAKAFLSGLLFMFFERLGVQPFLTVLVVLGCIRLCKDRRHRWLVVSFVFAWIVWFVSATTDGFLKQILSGFWYTDYRRVGAMASLFAIPLAAVGLVWLFALLQSLLIRIKKKSVLNPKRASIISGALLLSLMLVVQFFPAHVKVADSNIRAGLMAVHKQIKTRYSWQRIYTAEEEQFVKKAMDVVPSGSLFVNFPNDGSCYAYGIDGANVFFRRCSTTVFPGDEDVAATLRTKLCDIASSDDVQKAVKQSGVGYVLLLDVGKSDDATVLDLRYKKEDWQGIEQIDDSTPGFSAVLSEGDMRLYRIDYAFGG